MKKILALAFAGALAFSATACGAEEEEVSVAAEAAEEVKEVAEEEAEKAEEEVEETEEAVEDEEDDVSFQLVYEVPEEWESGDGGGYIWIAPPSKGNTMFLQVFDGEAGDDFSIMGTGKLTSQVEDTEPVVIEPFEAGNFTWHGYSINFPGYYGPETIVLLASNVDSESGKAVGARIDLGVDEAPNFSLDSEEIQSILASCAFRQ